MNSQIILLFGSPLIALAFAGVVYLIHRATPRPGSEAMTLPDLSERQMRI